MFEEPPEIFRYGLGLLMALLLLLWATLVMARLEHRKLVPILRDIPRSLLKREKIAPLNKFHVGIVLGFIGGGVALLDSVQGSALELGSFVTAFLILAGCAIAYIGFPSVGVPTTYLSSLIALMSDGNKLGSILSVFGSILMLFAFGEPTGKEAKNHYEENS